MAAAEKHRAMRSAADAQRIGFFATGCHYWGTVTAPNHQLTIVTVCLNDLSGLRATYQSIKEQSHPPAQWIVCDGGSNDGTVEWLGSIVDWPVLAWSSEADGGIYQGMNRGLFKARCDYVLFLNSGDTLGSSRTLDHVRAALAEATDKPSLLFGHCFEVDGSGARHLRRARPAWWVPLGMPTSHQAMIFRRESLPLGFDTRYRWSGDYAAVSDLYMHRRGKDFRLIDEVMCHFHLGGRSDLNRSQFLRETFEIRHRILRMNRFVAGMLHAAHHAQGWVKKWTPGLHRALRYG